MSQGAAESLIGGELASVLQRARSALKRAVLLEGAVVLGAGMGLALLAGAAASALGGRSTTVFSIEVLFLVLVLAWVTLRYLRLAWSTFEAPIAVANWLDRASAPRTEAIALLSAVELATRHVEGESQELRVAAIASATARATALDAPLLVRTESWRSLRIHLLAAVCVCGAMGLTAYASPRHFGHALRALLAVTTLSNPLKPVLPEPRFGDFRVTYRYPAYAERSSEIITDSSGNIRALPGTEVTIETNARDAVTQATLIVSSGQTDSEAEVQRLPVDADGRRLRVTMIVQRTGRYRFSLKALDGELLEERAGHVIELELDEPPEVTLLEPEQTPLEVNEKDRLNMVFHASDDFGLGEILVAWRILGSAREGKERLSSTARGSKQHAGSGAFDLAALNLRPGDRISYSVEARDNDTVNGPKVGASVTRELRVYSKNAHHQQVLALQEQALDELVHILGDNLENLVDVRPEPEFKTLIDVSDRTLTRAFEADELLTKTVVAVRKDPLGKKQVAEAFEAARRELSKDARKQKGAQTVAQRAFVAAKSADKESTSYWRRSQDGTVGSLEKNVVYLADLLNDQRLIDAAALAKELREQQQALKKALEDYKNAPDADKRKLLSQAIKDIKERIREIGEQLAKMRGSIPQDFVNPDAMDAKDSSEGMDRVQKMIEEGDLDGAMAELDKMLSDTEGMLSELEGGRQELESREYSEITEQAEKLWKDLEEVEREQRDLANKTEKSSKDVLERMKQRLGDASAFVDKQKKRLEQAEQGLDRAKPGTHMVEGDLHDQAQRRLDDAQKALEARDFGSAREMVENAAEAMAQLEQEAHRRAEQSRRFGDLFGGGKSSDQAERELRKARPILDDVLRDMERLMPSPDSLLSKEERGGLERQKERQTDLKDRANKIGEQLDRLGQQLPIVGQGTKDMLGEAAGAMQDAQGSLGDGDAPGALNQQRRAMDALSRLKQELQKMGQRGGSGGGGVPLPFGQPEGEQGNGEGNEGREIRPDEKVEIPKPEQYKAPAEFRQDILDAAKQGTVQDYKDAVRRYYEDLVK